MGAAPPSTFAAAAASWHTFYSLVGTAGATLVGLMFVAVTFGASLVKPETANVARAFIDPPFRHFVQVLFTSCLVVIPRMPPWLLGAMVAGVGAMRAVYLVRVAGHMRTAHAANGDIELSDWMSLIVMPAICHALLVASGVGLIVGATWALCTLAIATITILLVGAFGAWELTLWMVMTRAGVK
jgi:hypothetical protein